jgi:four helix bundle protein
MENTPSRSFQDLRVWQDGHTLVVHVYNITKNFPKDELFGITNQIRRAAVSITSNLSEGFNRNSRKEKLQFYYISLGSIAELQNQLLIARDVAYLNGEVFDKIEAQIITVQKQLNALIQKIRSIST